MKSNLVDIEKKKKTEAFHVHLKRKHEGMCPKESVILGND